MINGEKIKKLAEKAQKLIIKKNFEKAQKFLEEIYELDPNSIDYLMAMSTFYFLRDQDIDKALEYAEKGLAIVPENAFLLYMVSVLSLAKQDDDKTIENFEKALELDPKFEEIKKERVIRGNLFKLCLVIAGIYEQNKEFDKALNLLEVTLELDPKSIAPFPRLIDLYLEKGDPDKALKYSEKGLEIDPKNVKILFTAASTYLNKRNYDKTIEYFDKMFEVDPNWEVFRKWAAHWDRIGSGRHIIKGFEIIADLYVQKKEFDRALRFLEVASELYPKNVTGLINLALFYELSDNKYHDENKAWNYYQKALEYAPKNVELLFSVAVSYYNKKDYDKTIEYIEKALEVEPNFKIFRTHKLFRNELEILISILSNFAGIYEQKKEFDKARKLFELGFELDPTSPTALSHLMDFHRKNNDLDKALEWSEKSLEITPDNAHAMLMAAYVYSWKNDRAKTIEYYEKILEVDPNLEKLRKHKELVRWKKSLSIVEGMWKELGNTVEKLKIIMKEKEERKMFLKKKILQRLDMSQQGVCPSCAGPTFLDPDRNLPYNYYCQKCGGSFKKCT